MSRFRIRTMLPVTVVALTVILAAWPSAAIEDESARSDIIRYDTQAMSRFYADFDFLESSTVWISGSPLGTGCSFTDPPMEPAENQYLLAVQIAYNRADCSMQLRIGTPTPATVLLLEATAANMKGSKVSTDFLETTPGKGPASELDVQALANATKYRADKYSSWEEPARWYPCDLDNDSIACVAARTYIEPVNMTHAWIEWIPSANCAATPGTINCAFADRDELYATGWRETSMAWSPKIACAEVTAAISASFENRGFCDVLHDLPIDLPGLSTGPTFAGFTGTHARATPGTHGDWTNGSQPFVDGGCKELLKYFTWARKVTI